MASVGEVGGRSAGASTATREAGRAPAKESSQRSEAGKPVADEASPGVTRAEKLDSAKEAASNPAAAAEFAGVQGAVAAEASGETPVTDRRSEMYSRAADMMDRAETGDPEAIAEASGYRAFETQDGLKTLALGEFQNANGAVDGALNRVAEVNAAGAKLMAEQGSMLNPDERARLAEYTRGAVGEVTPEVEAASTALAGHLDDPLLRESFGDWNRQDQLDFFDGMSRNLAFSEAGRERLGAFTDGLQGRSDDPFAEAALELRDSLTGEDRARLDRSLGLAVGASGQSSIESDVLNGSEAFRGAVDVGGSMNGLITGLAPDMAEAGAHLGGHLPGGLGKGMRAVGEFLGPAGAVIDAVNLADQLQNGDAVGAFGSAAGIASAGLALAGSSMAGPVGAVAVGAEVVSQLQDSAEYADFAQRGLDHAMGADHPLRELVGQMSESGLNRLDFNSDSPPRQQLETRLANDFGPDWANYMSEYRIPASELFWANVDHEARTRANELMWQ